MGKLDGARPVHQESRDLVNGDTFASITAKASRKRSSRRISSVEDEPELLDEPTGDAFPSSAAKSSRKLSSQHILSVEDEPELLDEARKRRLRLRPEIPTLTKYKGTRVGRKAYFGDVDSLADDINQSDLSDNQADGGGLEGLGIPDDLEQKYKRLMQAAHHELEVMRAPSTEELAERTTESKDVKCQLALWGVLVESRIHLESMLGIGHRLPGSSGASAFYADNQVASEANSALVEVRGLLSELLALQQQLAARCGVPGFQGKLEIGQPLHVHEAEVWDSIDSQHVLDWALGVADEWKAASQLNSSRSFKVLDQPLSTQMHALAGTSQEKLRARCTPAPGKHRVFGASIFSDPGEDQRHDIYDDREFYVQLLHEVLTSAGGVGETNKPEKLSKELQELRSRRNLKKQKKQQYGTGASKGRKIRYVPIEKLQNFMAPRKQSFNGSLQETLGDDLVEAFLRSLFTQPK